MWVAAVHKRHRLRREAGAHPHPLTEGLAERHLACDICGASIVPGEGTASCRPCDYDECGTCFALAASRTLHAGSAEGGRGGGLLAVEESAAAGAASVDAPPLRQSAPASGEAASPET